MGISIQMCVRWNKVGEHSRPKDSWNEGLKINNPLLHSQKYRQSSKVREESAGEERVER